MSIYLIRSGVLSKYSFCVIQHITQQVSLTTKACIFRCNACRLSACYIYSLRTCVKSYAGPSLHISPLHEHFYVKVWKMLSFPHCFCTTLGQWSTELAALCLLQPILVPPMLALAHAGWQRWGTEMQGWQHFGLSLPSLPISPVLETDGH